MTPPSGVPLEPVLHAQAILETIVAAKVHARVRFRAQRMALCECSMSLTNASEVRLMPGPCTSRPPYRSPRQPFLASARPRRGCCAWRKRMRMRQRSSSSAIETAPTPTLPAKPGHRRRQRTMPMRGTCTILVPKLVSAIIGEAMSEPSSASACCPTQRSESISASIIARPTLNLTRLSRSMESRRRTHHSHLPLCQ
ncbi:hypothetical protein K437DRAFT_254448 [Tilletiaria anomala UBC 951]|uniref:Uncharacterized protein n=1 Tax=Tilletiaria anomala (strain ATCC 24038 / CBS 436.72 / UBC 951) TaxID=1037660 RepID=A0A066WMM3_TILAU|nr:uncharacterized protein K437DRAFT_254448 [Tilletiaria anomala UBC 951]KDN52259.1 hypothetical protein K437DRAFT_254448 [Tilletiaria anomala UBC 951]